MSAGTVNITVMFRARQGRCLYDFPFIRTVYGRTHGCWCESPLAKGGVQMKPKARRCLFKFGKASVKPCPSTKGEWKLKPTVQAPKSEEGIPRKMRNPFKKT